MRPSLPNGLNDSLLWNDEQGRGFCGAELVGYGDDYWQKYLDMDKTECGEKLTAARLEMVRRHYQGIGVDIGIGGGRFVSESGFMGFDINANAVCWLDFNEKYSDPYKNQVNCITCWDSLEHIENMDALLKQVTDYVFVSMPIYVGFNDCISSKHFRPGEHIHYFTHRGLIKYFRTQGFICVEYNDIESQLGREGIYSFAFKRVEDV